MKDNGIVELKVFSVSKCTEDGGAYIVILRENTGERMLPVLMERADAFRLLKLMKERSKLIFEPDTMADLVHLMFMQSNMDIIEVRIADVAEGKVYCHILYTKDGRCHLIRRCRATDGILLASVFKCPVTISEELLELQYMRDAGKGNFSIPINSVSINVLEEALKRAVEDENYELASQLRDEINRRK